METLRKIAYFFGRDIYLQLPWGNEGRGTKIYLWPFTAGATVLGGAYGGHQAWQYIGSLFS